MQLIFLQNVPTVRVGQIKENVLGQHHLVSWEHILPLYLGSAKAAQKIFQILMQHRSETHQMQVSV